MRKPYTFLFAMIFAGIAVNLILPDTLAAGPIKSAHTAEADANKAITSTAPAIEFKQAGPEEVVFDYKHDACNSLDIPDEAAHAFRDASGKVHLIASHYKNLAMLGPDLNHVHRDCHLIYAANTSAKPEEFDDLGWIESLYTTDGKTIHGIVSMDFHPHRHDLPCEGNIASHSCWYSALTQVDSTDGGRTFIAPPPGKPRFIAGAPYPYDSSHTEVVGSLVPTQMVPWNGYVYALFSMARTRDQQAGDCLVRTKDPGDPASWRAWDGHGFNVSFAYPYPSPPADTVAHTCLPVGGMNLHAPVRSLLLLPHDAGFLAVMQGTHTVNNKSVTGVLASTSTDLIHWSALIPIIDIPTYRAHGCQETPHAAAYGYPSLLDPESISLNFNTIGTKGYIYLTRFHYCEGLSRDLVRIPVEITYKK